ncbi:hypothetical protein RJ640_018024, partial [Escallonia rubra]
RKFYLLATPISFVHKNRSISLQPFTPFDTQRDSRMAASFLLLGLLLATTCIVTLASDHSPLQDFCVAIPNSLVMVNGLASKDPKLGQANDLFFSGLYLTGNTSKAVGLRVIPVTATQLPGPNTLGISTARIDYAPWGIIPPQTHPPASEILTVVDGSLQVGFVTSNPKNRLITRYLRRATYSCSRRVLSTSNGMWEVVRQLLLIAALNSQNPGVITITNAVFGSNPSILSDILAKAFQYGLFSGNISDFRCGNIYELNTRATEISQ